MSKKTDTTPKTAASSNWLALKKTLPKATRKRARHDEDSPRKRRKIDSGDSDSASLTGPVSTTGAATTGGRTREGVDVDGGSDERRNGESLAALRRMILGEVEYTEAQRLPGKYLALDCEMVGVGPEGAESALARVSIVNFHGAVLLDAFVRPQERVVDYRTEWSGIRERDMVHARPFAEVQSQVADLLKDGILIGHAVFNDLKALLLTHPRPLTRDTQAYAGRFKVSKSKYVALRNLVKQEVGVVIQAGEHSSVTDARATMAVYRIHRREWEKGSVGGGGLRALSASAKGRGTKGKELAGVGESADGEEGESDGEEDEEVSVETKRAQKVAKKAKGKKNEAKAKEGFPGGGRKGVSSGLGTIIRDRGSAAGAGGGGGGGGGGAVSSGGGKTKTEWWKDLGGGKKGSMRVLV